jgi:hypothetical protein
VLERWSLVAVRACRLVSPAGKSQRAALSPAFLPLVNTNFLLESMDDPNENRQSVKFIRSGSRSFLSALGAAFTTAPLQCVEDWGLEWPTWTKAGVSIFPVARAVSLRCRFAPQNKSVMSSKLDGEEILPYCDSQLECGRWVCIRSRALLG